MSSTFGALKSNAPYLFIMVGLIWAAIGVLTGAIFTGWPVAACIAAGVLVKFRPGKRLTWAWAVSTAVLGFIISLYQLYAWSPFLGGAFSSLAGEALAGFAVFALVHVFLGYVGSASLAPVKSETS
ncbi:MAG: hypothetical protein JRM73_04430 [Nitrososphaerota archaeon]|nr:hypothetical protein [Nitrososphaerota archaeon]